MISDLISNTLRYAILLALQLFVFNNIQFSGYVNPMVYILFVMMLPFETPVWLILFSSFLLGTLLDIFCDTPGLHGTSIVLLAFLRKFVLNLFSPRDGYESNTSPTLYQLGFGWYIWYASIMVLIHHLSFFMLEAHRFAELHKTLFRTLASGLLTLVFALLYQYMIYRPGSAKS